MTVYSMISWVMEGERKGVREEGKDGGSGGRGMRDGERK